MFMPPTRQACKREGRILSQLNSVEARVPPNEVLITGGDWNGHVGKAADGFDEVHGCFGYGEHNNKSDSSLTLRVPMPLSKETPCSRRGLAT